MLLSPPRWQPRGVRSTARHDKVTRWVFPRSGFSPALGLPGDSVTLSLPVPAGLRSRQGSGGAATLIPLPPAELSGHRRPVNNG